MASERKEEFKITEDEVKKIGEALKDETFRKLFMEYAEEIQNPENRKLYEQEIAQLEQERGMNVQFIHPQPGHVLKTSVDGEIKAFINICQNDKIGKPVATRKVSEDGKKGINWSIPHSHTPPREDLDKSKKKCKIYDVVFHPDTYRMAKSNIRFKKLVEDTAVDGIESQFGVKVDRKNIKRPKLNYKGTPTATVIRSKANEPAKPMDDDDPIKNMPYPFDDKTSEEKAKEMKQAVKKKQDLEKTKADKTKRTTEANKDSNTVTTPKYTITHRSDMDLQEYRNSPDSRPSTRPKELVISVELPLLSSSKPVELDIFEQKLVLQSKEPAAYKLDLKLPYEVDDSQGSAKFDKSKRCLIVTLPVVPAKAPPLPVFVKETQFENSVVVDDKKESDEKPLIEIINSTVEAQENESMSNGDICNESSTTYLSNTPKVSYALPSFIFSQDSETVTFVFYVKKIALDSVSKLFPLPNVCHIRFLSKGSGGFPIHYSFIAKFSAKNCFVPEHCSFDVTDGNAVLLLLKEKDSRHIWDTFQAGVSLDDLQDYIFPTEKSLQDDINKLEAESVDGTHTGVELVHEKPLEVGAELVQGKSVEVTEMTRKKLKIKIQNKKKEDSDRSSACSKQSDNSNPPQTVDADDELEEDDSTLPADIEVIHEKGVPNLQGILKLRSTSESSEDPSLSSSSGSPESPREEFFKKSVKFNDRVDQATFKAKAAVSSMTQALKSKRRRNRKKQEKRSRKNSGSSEGSSDDHKTSDDQNDIGVDSIEEISNEEDTDQNSEQDVDKNNEEEEYVDALESIDLEDQNVASVKMTEHAVGGMKSIEKEASSGFDNSKQEKLVHDIKEKLSMSKDDAKCDSDDDIENDGNTPEKSNDTKSKHCSESEHIHNEARTKTKATCTKETEGNENMVTVTSDLITKPSDLTKLIGDGDTIIKIKAAEKTSGEDSGVECGEGSGDKGDKSEVDTVLSWDDNPQITSQEHRTECAFQFSNAVIYDLDVD